MNKDYFMVKLSQKENGYGNERNLRHCVNTFCNNNTG